MSLNARQKAFIDYYLIYRNASKAARLAGYNGKSNVYGPTLLANLSIKAEIEKRLKEKHLSADEVLARLADMAMSNIADFADIQDASDLKKYRHKTHVIKKFKKKITTTRAGDTIVDFELELYPADNALVNLGRHFQLFTDKVQLDDWRTELIELFRQGKLTKEQVLNEFRDTPDLAKELFESIGLRAIESREDQAISSEVE